MLIHSLKPPTLLSYISHRSDCMRSTLVNALGGRVMSSHCEINLPFVTTEETRVAMPCSGPKPSS